MEKIKNISYVCVSALNRLDLDISENYDWSETIAIEWYEDIASHTMYPTVTSTKFFVGNGARVFKMPSDYIRHTRIGYRVGDRFYDLTVNNNISFDLKDILCSTGENAEVTGYNYADFPLELAYGANLMTPMYGIGGGRNIAYYRVDDSNRQILFSMDRDTLPNGEIIIEYLSTGRSVTGNTLINPSYVELLRRYIIKELCLKSRDPFLHKQANKRELDYVEAEFNNPRGSIVPTVQEVIDTLNSVPAFNLGR